jgi:hypothetical protein
VALDASQRDGERNEPLRRAGQGQDMRARHEGSSARAEPAIAPNPATPIAAPDCRAVLDIPVASPLRSAGVARTTAATIEAVTRPAPQPSTTNAANSQPPSP